jgi:hypothetical protein
MKHLLLLALLIPTSSFAGNGSGNVSATAMFGNIGATNISDPGSATVPESYIGASSGPSYFMLHASSNNQTTGANSFFPFYRDGVLYQVGNGAGSVKTYCVSLQWWASATNSSFQIVSATATFANNASSLTGPIYEGGVSGVGMHNSLGAPIMQNEGITFTFGTGSNSVTHTWPGVQINVVSTGMSIHLLCKEQ